MRPPRTPMMLHACWRLPGVFRHRLFRLWFHFLCLVFPGLSLKAGFSKCVAIPKYNKSARSISANVAGRHKTKFKPFRKYLQDTLPEWSKGVYSSSTSVSCVGSNPTGVIYDLKPVDIPNHHTEIGFVNARGAAIPAVRHTWASDRIAMRLRREHRALFS